MDVNAEIAALLRKIPLTYRVAHPIANLIVEFGLDESPIKARWIAANLKAFDSVDESEWHIAMELATGGRSGASNGGTGEGGGTGTGPQQKKLPPPTSANGRPKIQIPAPFPHDELTPIMKLLDDALSTNEPEPPMRSLSAWPVEIELREPIGLHELTSAGSNDEEGEQSRLPPPKSFVIARHNPCTLALLIERYARFYVVDPETGKILYYKRLQAVFVKHFLEFKTSRLPKVSGLLTMPVVLTDGRLLANNGLDRDLKTVFCIEPEIIERLPKGTITKTQVAKAMRFLTDEWFADVLTDYTGKCTLIALALSILERQLLAERPAFFVTAGKRGTGKTTACNMISLAITGKRAAAAAWSPLEEERRKAVFAALLQSVALIVWDNIKLGSAVACPTIEKTLTAPELEDRVLGESRNERASCATIQVFTGNNITAKGDMASRSLYIRLNTDRPDPENRNYEHEDPFAWTLAHRGKIITALYTILLGNPRFAQNAKQQAVAKTRFKAWWHLVGAPIEYAAKLAKPGSDIDFGKLFLATEDEDEESQNLADVLAAISRQQKRKAPNTGEFMASDIVKWMNFVSDPNKFPTEEADAGMLADYFAQDGRDHPSPKHIGRKLKSMLECPVLDESGKKVLVLKVARDKNSAGGITRYQVAETDAG